MKKKAQSFGKALIFGLVSLFGIGVMYIAVTELAVLRHVQPVFVNIINGSAGLVPIDEATKLTILSGYDNISFMLRTIPFILFFIIIIFMIVNGVRQEGESQYE